MATEIPQYKAGTILAVWASAAIPMAILGWLVAPALARGASNPILVRIAVLTIGLAWQFVLVLLLLYRETGNLQWSVIRPRLWLQGPRVPASGEERRSLWWWLVRSCWSQRCSTSS